MQTNEKCKKTTADLIYLSFQPPIEYNKHKMILNESIIDDLELLSTKLESNNEDISFNSSSNPSRQVVYIL